MGEKRGNGKDNRSTVRTIESLPRGRAPVMWQVYNPFQREETLLTPSPARQATPNRIICISARSRILLVPKGSDRVSAAWGCSLSLQVDNPVVSMGR